MDTHNLTLHKKKPPLVGQKQSGRQTGRIQIKENTCLPRLSKLYPGFTLGELV